MTTRTISEANFSPRKDSKRQNNLTATEAESALDDDELKGMLADQRILLTAMGDYVSDLIDVKTEEKDPRQLLKIFYETFYWFSSFTVHLFVSKT